MTILVTGDASAKISRQLKLNMVYIANKEKRMSAEVMDEDNMCPRCGATVVNPYKQREWVGLTGKEAAECWHSSAVQTWKNIEAKLKEKNL